MSLAFPFAGPWGRSTRSSGSDSPKSRGLFDRWFAASLGESWLQGHSRDVLDDHLLQDIGLKRADVCALKG